MEASLRFLIFIFPRAQVQGKLAPGVTSKDVILHIIGEIGTAGGTGHVIEFCGEAIRDLSMEVRAHESPAP